MLVLASILIACITMALFVRSAINMGRLCVHEALSDSEIDGFMSLARRLSAANNLARLRKLCDGTERPIPQLVGRMLEKREDADALTQLEAEANRAASERLVNLLNLDIGFASRVLFVVLSYIVILSLDRMQTGWVVAPITIAAVINGVFVWIRYAVKKTLIAYLKNFPNATRNLKEALLQVEAGQAVSS